VVQTEQLLLGGWLSRGGAVPSGADGRQRAGAIDEEDDAGVNCVISQPLSLAVLQAEVHPVQLSAPLSSAQRLGTSPGGGGESGGESTWM
jgi:hypothetical protein